MLYALVALYAAFSNIFTCALFKYSICLGGAGSWVAPIGAALLKLVCPQLRCRQVRDRNAEWGGMSFVRLPWGYDICIS